MKHDLADKWGERLLILEAQLEREPTSIMLWHRRGEARVTRFLLRRYGEIEAPDDAATPAVAASAPTKLSALERALLRMSLVIPNLHAKHPRPVPRERAAILERIKCARDEGRQIEEAEESWWEEINADAHRKALLLREREEQWKQRQRAECEKRRR